MKESRPRKMVQCEIVSIDCAEFLVNMKRHARRYATASGEALATGCYLAAWPAGACRSSYGPELRYYGPHETVAIVRILHISALWLGIVEAVVEEVSSALPATVISSHLYRPYATAFLQTANSS